MVKKRRASDAAPTGCHMDRVCAFFFVFCIVYYLESIGGTYIISVVQSMERQFQIPSTWSGTMISAQDFGYVPTVIILSYLGSRGNRARWIGGGCIAVSIAHMTIASPHFLFSEEVTIFNESVYDQLFAGKHTDLMLPENRTKLLLEASAQFGYCNADTNLLKAYLKEEKCRAHSTNMTAYTLVFMGLILLGVGHSMPWSLGLPLMDDNIKKKSLPTYFASMFFIKIMGPVSGFLVGAMCNKLYYTLTTPMGMTATDPRWIGAWWLGFVLIATVLFIPSLALFCFPHNATGAPAAEDDAEDVELRVMKNGAAEEQTVAPNRKPKKKRQLNLVDTHKQTRQTMIDNHDGTAFGKVVQEVRIFGHAVFQVIKQPVYTFSLIGRVFDSFSFKGFWSFLPKYLSNHYGIAQDKAPLFLASFGIVGFATGVMAGSIVMRKFKLEGRRAALYVSVCALISAMLTFSQITMGCTSTLNSIGVQAKNLTGEFNLEQFTTSCNEGCGCDSVSLSPVCSASGQQYFSPCHAGCEVVDYNLAEKHASFNSCKCIDVGTEVSADFCKDDCGLTIKVYFTVSIIGGFISGMGVVPAILIVLRSVPPEWRSISIGVSGFVVSLGTLFSPIAYGWVIDTTCDLWEPTCGEGTGSGSCLIYNPDLFRSRMHMVYGALRAMGSVMDWIVVYYAKDLLLMTDEEEEEEVDEDIPERKLTLNEVNNDEIALHKL